MGRAARLWRSRTLPAIVAAVGVAAAGWGAEPVNSSNAVSRVNDPANEREAGIRVDALIQAADAGEPTAQKAYDAAELGMSALWIAAARMNPEKSAHRAPLLILAEQAAGVRKTQRELLRLYDPPAFGAFYSNDGERLQAWLAAALRWENPPSNMPGAMVLAAPAPTMAWLESQDEQALKTPGLLVAILRQWGSLAAMGREHQYLPRLQALVGRLAASPAVCADEQLSRTVLQLAGDTACRDAEDFAVASLGHPSAAIRGIAAATLGRLRGDAALHALTERVAKEPEPAVQTAIADALGAWPKEPEVGEACLQLYKRAANADVRRAVLNAAGSAEWPAREPLVRRAYTDGEGAALLALSLKPVPGLESELLDRLKNYEGQYLDPSLLDAVAATRVADAIPVIADILQREKNIAMRLKYVAALESIGGNGAGAALLRLLDGKRDDLEVEYVVTSLGRLRHAPAVPRLARIAKDPGTEIGIRVQAIWALGRMKDLSARAELEDIQRRAAELFAASGGRKVSADLAYHSRLVSPRLLLARLSSDPDSVGKEIGRMFADEGPIEQTTLLAGLSEQGIDHPVIAAGFDSEDFAVFYMAIAAARSANPAKYGPRVRRLAASPYVQALEEISLETWDLKGLLSEGWR